MSMLTYKLPSKSAQDYASTALAILQNFEKDQSSALPLLLRADVVLTISGVRAYTTYIDSSDAPGVDFTFLRKELGSHGISFFEDSISGYEHYAENWNVINHSAFEKLAEVYGHEIIPKLKTKITNATEMIAWNYFIELEIRSYLDHNPGEFTKRLLQDQFAAHNIRFGILLGYPTVALLTSSEKDLLEAKIAFSDRYNSAHPTYHFPIDLAANSDILNHQKLWSEILTLVYESDWHKNFAISAE